MLRQNLIALLILLASSGCTAFTSIATVNTATSRVTSLNAYVPDGLTADQYRKIKLQDRKRVGKDLGRLGPRGFKSRSMQAWQEAYEKGQTGHSFAPLNYREKVMKGEISWKDVPYMVRGGSWDNSDVPGARRLSWTKTDKEYAKGGYKKEQSFSILGSGPGFNWTGEQRNDDGQRRLIPGLS